MTRVRAVVWRSIKAFWDDQMTHHAAALTYFALMSLFPAGLLGVSLLVLVGEYPRTYNAIVNYLRDVAPSSVVDPLDRSLREALQSRGTAATALAISIPLTLYGMTGALEATRRALNVAFKLQGKGRTFLQRKTTDVAFALVLLALVLSSIVMVFVGGHFARDMLGFVGLGATAADVWSVARWPGAVLVAMLIFALIYHITPDVPQRAFRLLTPGAVVGVLLWLIGSLAFSLYVSRIADVGAIYGAFTGAILLVGWLWLTNVALLYGAELNAAIERQAAPARRSTDTE